MSSTGLSQRLQRFNSAFKNLLGPKNKYQSIQGSVEEPLVSSHASDEDSYAREHGVLPQQGGFQQQGLPQESTAQDANMSAAGTLPDDRDELQQLTVLARDAAEILFEMTAMQDKSPEAHDMLEKSQQIEAQLRGMIGDFKGGDEMLLSQALEAFDSLTNTTTEYRAALEGKSAVAAPEGTSQANTGPRLQPPGSNPFQKGAYGSCSTAPIATAPGQKPDKDDEPPLISFD